MKAFIANLLLFSSLAVAMFPVVAGAIEINTPKVSMPHISVPHVTTPQVNTHVFTPQVNTSAQGTSNTNANANGGAGTSTNSNRQPGGSNQPSGGGGQGPSYRQNVLNGVTQGAAILQGQGNAPSTSSNNGGTVLHTVPFADLNQALPNTLIQPSEPVAGLSGQTLGTGALPQTGAPVANPSILTPKMNLGDEKELQGFKSSH